MCKWSGISSQEISKKKHKQQQNFFYRKKSHWLPKHLLPAQRRVHLNDLTCWTSQRVRSSLRSSTPPDSFWKGETKQKTCFSCCLDIQLIDKILQQFCVPLICRVAYLLAINSGMRCPGNCIHHLVHQYQQLKRSISYSKEAGISHISHSLGVLWASLLPSQQCTRRAKEMQFANAIVSTTFFQPESSSNQLRTTGNTPTATFLSVCMTWVAEDSGCAKPNSNDFSSRTSMVFTWFCFSQNLEVRKRLIAGPECWIRTLPHW